MYYHVHYKQQQLQILYFKKIIRNCNTSINKYQIHTTIELLLDIYSGGVTRHAFGSITRHTFGGITRYFFGGITRHLFGGGITRHLFGGGITRHLFGGITRYFLGA